MHPNKLLSSVALLLTSSAAADGTTLLPSVANENEQLPSSQLHDQHQYQQQHVPQVAKHPRLLRPGRRTSGIGNGEVPTKAAQDGNAIHANTAAGTLHLERPARRRGDRSLYEYDGKLKLKWGKDGVHAPGSHIDIVERKHRDVPNARNKKPSPGGDHDQDGTSTANSSTDIDPILYYCTHVYACESLTAQISTLTNAMESLPSYEAMIVQCEGVTSTSYLIQIEFCNDARVSYQSEAKAMLEQKEATEAAVDAVCKTVRQLEAQSPFKITENVCEDNFNGLGGIVPQGCVDTMHVCSDGTVICEGGSMPHESCPGEDDCDTLCGLDQKESPCVCTERASETFGEGIEEFWVDWAGTEAGDAEEEEKGDEDLAGEHKEEKVAEALVGIAQEEIDEVGTILHAVEEEQKVAAEIEDLRAKIAKLEAMEGGG